MSLISTNAELKQFTSASSGLDVRSLSAYLEHSKADRQLKGILTETLFDTLHTKYTDGVLDGAGNEKYKALLPYAQSALAKLAVYEYICEGHVKITDAGLQSIKKEERAFPWQQKELKRSYLEKIYFALEDLIRYLLNNTADFSAWAASSAFAESRQFFINRPEDFNKWVKINDSYRTLVAVQPVMRHLEQGRFKALLSATLFDALKAEIKADNLSEDNKALMVFIEPAIAYLTMAEAIEDLHIEITADGGYVYSLAAIDDSTEEKQAAEASQLRAKAKRLELKGLAWLQDLTDFLNANATESKYAGYFNSDNYEDPTAIDRSPDETMNSFNTMG